MECLGNGPGDVIGVGNKVIVFGDRHRDAADIGLLEGIGADGTAGYLPGDRHHWDGIHRGIGNRGYQIGGPRATCRHADTHPACCSGETFCRMAGTLLMAHQNMADSRVHQGVVKRQDRPARNSEDVGNSGCLKG